MLNVRIIYGTTQLMRHDYNVIIIIAMEPLAVWTYLWLILSISLDSNLIDIANIAF